MGIVMAKVVPSRERDVHQFLKEKSGVEEIYQAFGEYDFLLILRGRDATEVREIVKGLEGMKYVVDVKPILISPDNSYATGAQAC